MVTGIPQSSETALPKDHTVGLCLEPYGGPRGVAVSYERGTPAEQYVAALRTALASPAAGDDSRHNASRETILGV